MLLDGFTVCNFKFFFPKINDKSANLAFLLVAKVGKRQSILIPPISAVESCAANPFGCSAEPVPVFVFRPEQQLINEKMLGNRAPFFFSSAAYIQMKNDYFLTIRALDLLISLRRRGAPYLDRNGARLINNHAAR